MGETEIKGTPKRIAVLDWANTEYLLTLGVKPVAAVSPADYNKFRGIGDLVLYESQVIDLGFGWAANMESIVQSEPDLILGSVGWGHAELYDKLSEIAPTVIFGQSALEGNMTDLDLMEQNFIELAKGLNVYDKGVAELEKKNTRFKDAARKLEASGLGRTKAVYGEVFYDEKALFRIFLPYSTYGVALEKLGLEYATPEIEANQEVRYVDIDLEGLSVLDGPDVHFIYKEGSHSINELKDNPVWSNLEFAQTGRLYQLEHNEGHQDGGPISMGLFADKIAEVLTNQ